MLTCLPQSMRTEFNSQDPRKSAELGSVCLLSWCWEVEMRIPGVCCLASVNCEPACPVRELSQKIKQLTKTLDTYL